MTEATQWGRVRSLFQAALERAPDARDDFVRHACGDDAALRSEVASLLAAHADAGEFLEAPLVRLGGPAPEASYALRAGERLGHFEVVAPLGAGGMGEVYRARDTHLGRDVALKILPPTFAADPQRLARFERESRALASLKHPNIAAIHSIEHVDGVRLLVLELIEGQTLAERLRDGAMPTRDALDVARQLVLALQAAHERGIVHRDLKPANVKLSSTGHVTLLDFGLAKARGDDDTVAGAANAGLQTTAGLILGTLGYMSPEQARGRPVDQRADIWAFGAVLFEMLVGRPAFRGDTPSDTIVAVLEREPDWSALPDTLPPTLTDLLRRCLAKPCDARLGTIGDALSALDTALAELSGAALPATGTPRTGPSGQGLSRAALIGPDASENFARGRTTGRRARLAVVAVVVLVAALLGWWRFTRPLTPIDSLAILPFENRGSDPDAEYLGDEFAENLIAALSRTPSLTVMARGTTARFRGTSDARGAGQALSVGAVLSGAVSRRSGRLVVSAELIDVVSGARLWGDTYDRPASDLPQLQGAIVARVANGLRLTATNAPSAEGTRNAEAYELVMRARHLLLDDSEERDTEARGLFEHAAALDPGFVEAHLGVASTHLRAAAAGYAPPGDSFARADASIQRVLAIEPGNVRARAARAVLLYQRDWNWAAADREFRALVAEPALFMGNQYHAPAVYYYAIGRSEESVSIVERALRTDPGNTESHLMLCDFQLDAGRLDDAATCYRAVVGSAPEDTRPFFGLAEISSRRSDLRGALTALRKAYELSGEREGVRLLDAARSEQDYRAVQKTVAAAHLEALQSLARERYVSPLDVARGAALAGDRTTAFRELDRALAERSAMLVLLRADHAWDDFRSDARFVAAVRRVGIP